MGIDFSGEKLRQQIIDHIRTAQFLVADLGKAPNTADGGIEPNFNTCIEAGIAVGAGVQHYMLCRAPAAGSKTDKLPFMFRDHQIHYYQDDAELLALAHKLSLPHRRRVINHELAR
jgi:hypothetical protein